MSMDSRLRLARKNGTGARLRDFEVPAVVEALQLLRACERAEAKGPLPAPPFPAFLPRDLVEAELRATLETGRDRILDLGGDCDAMDQMMEGAMHSLDMRVQGAARDAANPVDQAAPPSRPTMELQAVDLVDAAAELVQRHAARLGMDPYAAGVLEAAIRKLGVKA